MVPPSGESQLNPSSTEDSADDDFSLRLPELVDLLDRFDAGDLPTTVLLPLKIIFFDDTSMPSDIWKQRLLLVGWTFWKVLLKSA